MLATIKRRIPVVVCHSGKSNRLTKKTTAVKATMIRDGIRICFFMDVPCLPV
jgi:hypothetical protein